LAYGLLARARRPALQAAVAAQRPAQPPRHDALRLPVVLVQCESFFDARRLHPGLGENLLGSYDRCRGRSVQWGRLKVPSWAANPGGPESAVLTGLAPASVGFDPSDPYPRLAQRPVWSRAWRLRAEGYRTLCLPPFDRRFYRRDRVMPNLGFDAFLG